MDKEKIVYETKSKPVRKMASEKGKEPTFAWMIGIMSLLFVLGMWKAQEKDKEVNE